MQHGTKLPSVSDLADTSCAQKESDLLLCCHHSHLVRTSTMVMIPCSSFQSIPEKQQWLKCVTLIVPILHLVCPNPAKTKKQLVQKISGQHWCLWLLQVTNKIILKYAWPGGQNQLMERFTALRQLELISLQSMPALTCSDRDNNCSSFAAEVHWYLIISYIDFLSPPVIPNRI